MSVAKISVNVAVCGAIPRPRPFLNGLSAKLDHLVDDATSDVPIRGERGIMIVPRSNIMASSSSDPMIPSWAAPVTDCDARLEPVCEAMDHHPRLDLTKRSSFIIGRSPTANLQLLYSTCSRIHALLVHHANGAFLIKDLESGHGTYVNGVQIPTNAWHRLKKGALIRFGGIGAPAFIFKTFCVKFGRMVSDLDDISSALSLEKRDRVEVNGEVQVSCIRGDGGMACVLDSRDAPDAALTLLHTRMNSCGHMLSQEESTLMNQARKRFLGKRKMERCGGYNASPSPALISDCDKAKDMKKCLKMSKKPSKIQLRVSFCTDQPKSFHAPSVTPEEVYSDDEVDIAIEETKRDRVSKALLGHI